MCDVVFRVRSAFRLGSFSVLTAFCRRFAGWLPEAGRAPPVCRVVWSATSDLLAVCREKVEGVHTAASSSILAMPECAWARDGN